ncbi:hypothetical protein JCM24511_07786 [Saitozyma sp. JCM 24511]|nr:hypothetical protein JCM24511_07786 [Saitozyma sp. JCM 24511]
MTSRIATIEAGGHREKIRNGVPPEQVQPSGVDVTVLETLAMLKAQIAKLEALVPAGAKPAPRRPESTVFSNDERTYKRGLTVLDSEQRWHRPYRRHEQGRSAEEHRPASRAPPGGYESLDRPGDQTRGDKRTAEPSRDRQDKRMRLNLEDRIEPRHSTSTPANSQAMRDVTADNDRAAAQGIRPGEIRDYRSARSPPESKDSPSSGPRAQEETYIGNPYRGYDARGRGRGRGGGGGGGVGRGRGWAPKRF